MAGIKRKIMREGIEQEIEQSRFEMVKKMFAEKFSLKQISSITGFDIEKIKKITMM